MSEDGPLFNKPFMVYYCWSFDQTKEERRNINREECIKSVMSMENSVFLWKLGIYEHCYCSY